VVGARGFCHSNPCVISVVALTASLGVFDAAGIERRAEKQQLITGYLEALLGTMTDKVQGLRDKHIPVWLTFLLEFSLLSFSLSLSC